MKQRIGVFLLSALLVLSLSACGETGGAVGNNDIPGDEYATPDNGNDTNENNATDNDRSGSDTRRRAVDPNGGTNGTGANGSPIPGNNPGADNSIVGRNGTDEGLFGTNGTSYEQMVRNGLVHDTDGDLTDGENSHS